MKCWYLKLHSKLLRKLAQPHIRYSRNYILQCNNSHWGEWIKGDITAEMVRQNIPGEGLLRRKRERRYGQRLRRNKTKIPLLTKALQCPKTGGENGRIAGKLTVSI